MSESMSEALPEEPRLTVSQYEFLRKMRNHLHGLPLEHWPRAAVWRKWMKRPRFVAAMQSLQNSYLAETDLLLAGSAARAARLLQAVLSGGGAESESGRGIGIFEIEFHHKKIKSLSKVLYLEMQRRQQMRQHANAILAAGAEPPADGEPSADDDDTV
jgi:hypothetical protein